MKVTGLRAACVTLPCKQAECWTDGCRDGVNNVLVEIETDAGIVEEARPRDIVGSDKGPFIADRPAPEQHDRQIRRA